jgi:hypothetical protein
MIPTAWAIEAQSAKMRARDGTAERGFQNSREVPECVSTPEVVFLVHAIA